ncbi:hypothetical protein JD844_026396 [Phrynosoma platyrhinos]|uniref:Protein preY, mitochondrial n=1 Tax=Phrynosoma platyrhinos TaxID=52577 RepID=A0ABQ7SES3_PHRPL|nr:hypothetical protein JD844_026396 [Phrynosoma platyrhinos]
MSALLLGTRRLLTRVPLWPPSPSLAARALCEAEDTGKAAGESQPPRPPFDLSLLEILVCPLSKKPLRYEESTNELINEELGIAYPITDGIPNMIPQAARMIRKEKQEDESERA